MSRADRADPWTAASGLLALRPANNYAPTVVFCGGSNQNDQANPKLLSANARTIAACYRMDIGSSGWQNEDPLPNARVMPQMVQMPCVIREDGSADFVAMAASSSSRARAPASQAVRATR